MTLNRILQRQGEQDKWKDDDVFNDSGDLPYRGRVTVRCVQFPLRDAPPLRCTASTVE